jgi:hypothetical protein
MGLNAILLPAAYCVLPARTAGFVPECFSQQSYRGGKARYVAISPDGEYILSVVDEKGQQSLRLRNVPTNNTQVNCRYAMGTGLK